MNSGNSIKRFIAGLTAALIMLSPLSAEGSGLFGNGLGISASAEDIIIPSEDTVNGADDNGGDPSVGDPDGDDSEGDPASDGDNGEGDPVSDGDNGEGDPVSDEDDGESDPASDEDDGESDPADEEEEAGVGEVWFVPDASLLPDSDELFDEYVNRTFYGSYDIGLFSDYGRRSLNDGEREIYDGLVPEITKIANGESASTQIMVQSSSWTVTNESLHSIMNALLTDLPYDLYWYDKTSGLGLSYIPGSFTFKFSVAGSYAGSSQYTVNTAKTGAASKAAANARSIVQKYAGESDFNKLNGYRSEICKLVSYNTAAVGGNVSYGDPWQLIYVFDGNTSTNVVCEGYSKAFQYLCDLTDFDNTSIKSAVVTGDMDGGGHMWNIVSIDGVSYLVDVTNCDSGSIGADDLLFLKGMSDPSGSGFTANVGGRSISYVYDTDTKNTFSSAFLTVSAEDYDPYNVDLNDIRVTRLTDKIELYINGKAVVGDTVTISENDTIGVRVRNRDYIDHAFTINGVNIMLNVNDDGFTSSLEVIPKDLLNINSDHELNIDLTEDAWSNAARSNYARLDIGENITAYAIDADTKLAVMNDPLETGDYCLVGREILLMFKLNDYIDHKLAVNETECEPEINGDPFLLKYIFRPSKDTTVLLLEEKWSDEKLSQFVKLDIDGDVSVYSYNERVNEVSAHQLSTGDYYPVNAKLVIRTPNSTLAGRYISINGVKADGKVNSDGDYQVWAYPASANDNGVMKIKLTEGAVVNFDPNTVTIIQNCTDTILQTGTKLKKGDTVDSGENLLIKVSLNDYINHRLTVNGTNVEPTLGEDNVSVEYNLVVSGTSLTVKLTNEQWSAEELSEYVKLDVYENINVCPYLDSYKAPLSDHPLSTGDYYPKNKRLEIIVTESVRNGRDVLINGTAADGTAFYGSYYISEYPVECDGDTLTIEFKSSLRLTDDNGFGKEFDSFDAAFSYINKNGSTDKTYTITMSGDMSADKLVLPTKAKQIIFDGEGTLSLNMASLNIPVNTTFKVLVSGVGSTPAAIKVAAGKVLELDGGAGALGSITGTKTSSLIINRSLDVGSISTFGTVTVADGFNLVVAGNVSAVTNFAGTLLLPNAESTAVITNVISDSGLTLFDTDGAAAKVTVTNINADSKLSVKIVGFDSEPITIESGREILTAGSSVDFTKQIEIVNTMSSGKKLRAYLYGKTVRAEYGEAVVVRVAGKEVGRYPNLELAFKDVTDTKNTYFFDIAEDITVTKLDLPTKAPSLWFGSSGGKLILDMDSLNIPVTTTFLVSVEAVGTKPLNVKVAAGQTLEIIGGISNLGTVTGTSTSVFRNCSFVEQEIQNISTFGKVIFDAESYYTSVTGNITGVTHFEGKLALPNANSKVNIINVGNAYINMTDTNGAIAKVTVTNVDDDGRLSLSIVGADGKVIPIESGREILTAGSAADFTEKISISNTTEEGTALNAYLYGRTIKAEWGGAIKLSDGENEWGFPNLDLALKKITDPTKSYEITLNENIKADKLVLPTTADKITFSGTGKLDLNMTSLNIPVNTTFGVPVNGTNAKPLAIKVAAGKTLSLDTASNIGAISGTKTSSLLVTSDMEAASISTFDRVSINSYKLTVTGNVSGVTEFSGKLALPNSKSTAAITNIGTAEIKMTDTKGVIPKVTVTNVDDKLTLTIVDGFGAFINIEGGRTVLTAGSAADFTDKVKITNTLKTGEKLSAFLYGRTIKAEYADAITLSVGGVDKNYPNLDAAFKDITDASENYTIILNADVETNKLVLPTKAKRIIFNGTGKLDLNMTSLNIPVNTTFLCPVNGGNDKPLAIKVAAGKTLTLGTSSNIGAISGTNTSELNINQDMTAASISTFSSVLCNDGKLTVTGNISGVKQFSGYLTLPNAKSTAVIDYIGIASAKITMTADEKGAFAKLTLAHINSGARLILDIVDESGASVALENAAAVLTAGSADDFTERVYITNKSTAGNELTAFLYGRTIKAEYAKAIYLSGGGVNKYYPNLDAAFKDITNTSATYRIELNTDIDTNKLVLPTKAEDITFIGSGALNLDMTLLNIPVNTTFGVPVNGTNAKPLAIKVAAEKRLVFTNTTSKIGAVSGTKTSSFLTYKDMEAASISTFSSVGCNDGKLTVTGNVSGVANLRGNLALPNAKSTAVITNAAATIIMTDTNGVIPKVTVTNVVDGKTLTLTIVDADNNPIEIESGRAVLNAGSAADFTDKVKITNTLKTGEKLSAFLYGRIIKAEYADAITLSVGGVKKNYPNLDAAFKDITDASAEYTIKLNTDVKTNKLVLPTKAKRIIFDGTGKLDLNMTSLNIPVDTAFGVPVNGTNAKPLAIKVAAEKRLVFLSPASRIGAVSGTKTSEFLTYMDMEAASISTFSSVGCNNGKITVTGNVSGVTQFDGILALPNAKSTAVITNAAATIIMTDTNGVIPKVTVTNVDKALTLTIVDADNNPIDIESGRAVLNAGSAADFTDKVKITNTLKTGEKLSAFLYGRTIKAEYAEAITLYLGNDRSKKIGNYPNLDAAFKEINDVSKDYWVDINVPVSLKTLVIPTKAKSVNFGGNCVIELEAASLNIPVDTAFNTPIRGTGKNPLAIKVAAERIFTLGHAENVGAVTGTKTSILCIPNTLTLGSIANFRTVNAVNPYDTGNSILTVTGNISGVTNFYGILALENAKSTAAVTNIGSAEIRLTDTNGAIPKVTVTNVGEELTLKIVDANGDLIKIKNGTAVLTAGSAADFTQNVKIANKSTLDEDLTAFLYGRTVKAEYAEAIKLSDGDDKMIGNYPNLDAAFKAINDAADASENYTIYLDTTIYADKLVIPTKAESITFQQANGDGLELNMTSLNIPTDVKFLCSVKGTNAKPLAIKVAAGKTLRLFGDTDNIGAITGTSTSKLTVMTDALVESVSTFSEIDASMGTLIVKGNISGVTRFGGTLALPNAKSTAVITNISEALVKLTDNDGKLAKLTVTGIDKGLTLNILDENGALIPLENGTAVLTAGSAADFTKNVKIANKLESGKELSAFLYGRTIKAEYAEAIKLSDSSGDIKNYPNLDAAFKAINDAANESERYIIYLNTTVSADKLVIPTKAKSITFNKLSGSGFELNMTALNIPTNVGFLCPVKGTNAKPLAIKVAAGKTLTLGDVTDNITLTGTNSSKLSVTSSNVEAESVSTFGEIDASRGMLYVKGNVSGVTKFNGTLALPNAKSTAVITNISEALVKLTDNDGKLAKLTVTGIDKGLTLNILDENGVLIPLENGRAVLTAGSAADFTDKVKIENKSTADKGLTAYLYGRTIKAEHSQTAALYIGDSGTGLGYPNLEAAFKAITDPSKDYTIELNDDVYTNKLVIPTTAKSITIKGYGRSLYLENVTAVNAKIPLTLNNISIVGSKGCAFTASADLTFKTFASDCITSVKGNANSVFTVDNYVLSASSIVTSMPEVTGFGKAVIKNTNYIAATQFLANRLELDNSTLRIPSGNSNIAVVELNGSNGAAIYLGSNFKPMRITGTASESVTGSFKLASDDYISDETCIFLTKTLGTASFDVSGIPGCKNGAITVKDGKAYIITP